MLRRIRENFLVNRLVRSGLRGVARISNYVNEAATSRWPTSGVIEVDFEGIGFLMSSKGDDGLADRLFYKRPLPETPDLRLFLGIVSNSHIVFDVGANTGLFSLVSAIRN